MVLHKIKLSEELQKRIISAGILAPIVLFMLWLGGSYFNTMIIFTGVIMTMEWCNIIYKGNTQNVEKIRAWELLGIIYVGLFITSVIHLRALPGGFGIVLFMMLIVWSTDIAAYFAGRLIGGAKIAPSISPNKTWAGLFGGMAAAGFIGFIASFLTDTSSTILLTLISSIFAVVAQIGDFFESWIKRCFDVKDSSNLIPGHGGLMDRLDGFTTVAPLFALITLIKGGVLF